MKLVIVNGGPRVKNWNTASMLEAVARGAESAGAEVEWVDLYRLDFKGCRSCFACQRVGAEGRCAAKDELSPVLEHIIAADALAVGSPIYFGDVTGETRSFLERLWFPGLNYNKEHTIKYENNRRVGLVFTMNVPDAGLYERLIVGMRGTMDRFMGKTEALCATDTLQFDDYGKYVSDVFDAEAKRRRHEEVFPQDLEKAEALGVWLAGK